MTKLCVEPLGFTFFGPPCIWYSWNCLVIISQNLFCYGLVGLAKKKHRVGLHRSIDRHGVMVTLRRIATATEAVNTSICTETLCSLTYCLQLAAATTAALHSERWKTGKAFNLCGQRFHFGPGVMCGPRPQSRPVIGRGWRRAPWRHT